ncbi:hypothetical protein AGMMS49944_31230 [Spirochaetia bacterium]|nr:hypothetical protein AGMMS49944_31230 [Spirochaetia bacterium]
MHGSTNHLWGERYFARMVKDPRDFSFIMHYIDNNPVKAGLSCEAGDWKASGAYYVRNNLSDLVDYNSIDRIPYIKLLPKPEPNF